MALLLNTVLISASLLKLSAELDAFIKKLSQNLTDHPQGIHCHIPSPSPVISKADNKLSSMPIPIDAPLPILILNHK